MDIVEMEHNNSVEISQRVLWKMLSEAKEKEKQQIINAIECPNFWGKYKSAEDYYYETYKK
jgi:predicted DNA-binding protein (UPF0251 family)